LGGKEPKKASLKSQRQNEEKMTNRECDIGRKEGGRQGKSNKGKKQSPVESRWAIRVGGKNRSFGGRPSQAAWDLEKARVGGDIGGKRRGSHLKRKKNYEE